MGGKGSGEHGARPGVKLTPLTELELNTLQMISEGFSPRELVRKGEHLGTLYMRLHRMRLKLSAFTNAHMTAEGLRRGLIK